MIFKRVVVSSQQMAGGWKWRSQLKTTKLVFVFFTIENLFIAKIGERHEIEIRFAVSS